MLIGEYMKEFRIEHSMTQKKLAEELNIPGSNGDVCRLENGTERTLNALRARFLIYVTTGGYWGGKKETAKRLLITMEDLNEREKMYLVYIILS